jgi:hypothetical protein
MNKTNFYRRGAETQSFYFDANAYGVAEYNIIPLRLCASAVQSLFFVSL